MPTPFYHLSLAIEILQNPDLNPTIRKLVEGQWGAFLFGNTAPDVQTISGQTREATHFFDLPLEVNERPAWETLIRRHPLFANPVTLPVTQAVFMAGYLSHLLADWYWIEMIFAPIFGPTSAWGDFRQRLYLHNVLRCYLDQSIIAGLPGDCGQWLTQARPDHWLPFVQDADLWIWRDYLTGQLHPGAPVQTVEVFAARQGIPAADYYALIHSEERMQNEVFSHLPSQRLPEYRRHLVAESVSLLQTYFNGRPFSFSPTIARAPSEYIPYPLPTAHQDQAFPKPGY